MNAQAPPHDLQLIVIGWDLAACEGKMCILLCDKFVQESYVKLTVRLRECINIRCSDFSKNLLF